MPRGAPMLIWLDDQHLPWSDDERAVLAESEEDTLAFAQVFPGGVHGRPDGSGAGTTLLILFNYENSPSDVVFPLPDEPHYAEVALRGVSTAVPRSDDYIDKGVRPYVDGGYYIRNSREPTADRAHASGRRLHFRSLLRVRHHGFMCRRRSDRPACCGC